MIRLRRIALWTLATSLAACGSGPAAPSGDARSAIDVHRAAGDAPPVRIVSVPGAAERSTVVHRPPEVWGLWIPDHLDRARDMVIGGHYVYVVLRHGEFRDPQGIGTWYVEDLDRDLGADGAAAPEDRAALTPFLAADADGRWVNERAVRPSREDR